MADREILNEIRAAYEARLPLYRRLKDEVEFALGQAISVENIKLHSLNGRIKTMESVLAKAVTKSYDDPLKQIPDLVGVRAVCLFISDLPRLQDIVNDTFSVSKVEDKILGSSEDAFGYMSTHFDCAIRRDHTGPRYDDLRDMTFEVQCRTILMDAWANVSHHLAYKGESSIPAHLRKDFHALSGLFYVADRHFELFFADKVQAGQLAVDQVSSGRRADLPLDLDTVRALLSARYVDRNQGDDSDVSELVEELATYGFTELRQLEAALDRADDAARKYEEMYPPGGYRSPERYAAVGIVRMAIAIADPNYAESKYQGDTHAEFRRYLTD